MEDPAGLIPFIKSFLITRSALGSYFSSLPPSNFLLLSGLAEAVAVDELAIVESIILVSAGENGSRQIERHAGDFRPGRRHNW